MSSKTTNYRNLQNTFKKAQNQEDCVVIYIHALKVELQFKSLWNNNDIQNKEETEDHLYHITTGNLVIQQVVQGSSFF